jgi:hypothetical protein
MPIKLKTSEFVISLDFELNWGVHDLPDSYKKNVLGARSAIPELLELFSRYEISATWATVGMLFCKNYKDFLKYKPEDLPKYNKSNLNPYLIPLQNCIENELYYAFDLITLISNFPRQEIASHSYSHYYCTENGQTLDAFSADCDAAVKIAKDFFDVDLTSYVFPRNLINPLYLDKLKSSGFTAYRCISDDRELSKSARSRLFRLIDTYIPVLDSKHKKTEKDHCGMKIVYSDRFLRPSSKYKFLNRLKVIRIKREMHNAAKNGDVYHLWWHPHNFGIRMTQNLSDLEKILDYYTFLKQKYGMKSVTMRDCS